ncbi:MAG TPA: hypothetical protein P5572_17955 [Phycisphaerae bacterium]|nr:hypothetical protein [Phycisphaerae bacterium]
MSRKCRSTLLGLASLVFVAAQVGCVSAVKHVYYEVRGAKVKVMPAQTATPRSEIVERFAPYESFQFEPAKTTLGPEMCPPRVLTMFDETAQGLRTSEDLGEKLVTHYPGGAPTLNIATELQFVESKGLLGTALLIGRVRMTDGSTTVLDAVVMTQSKSFREGGREELAKETARGLGRFLISAKTGEKDLDDMLP